MTIAENLSRVREQLAQACHAAGRPLEEVQLMAVSKVHPSSFLLEAYAAGQRLFGENRVQEFQAKSSTLGAAFYGPDRASFHLIGPLQNNKTAKAAEIFDAVDTLDSLKTAQRLESAVAEAHKALSVLVEVKLSEEESKHGIDPSALPELLEQLAPFRHLQVRGLMTVPPWSEDPELARPYFRKLRDLRDQLQPSHPQLTELSMGMSNDFAVAIAEGSTCVRIGTAIFGRRISAP
ncbi:MAG: YggS family pyridoxal phosphate-dependent enzyme [Acidobacteriaceae bacterium]